MILGIGVDLCDIGRMKKAVAREGFAVRVFSKGEIGYAEGRGDPAAHYAAAFAAKEALAKAGGWGVTKNEKFLYAVRRARGGRNSRGAL